MSNEVSISIKNLTKTYKLYDKPSSRLKEALNPFRKKYHHEFSALNNVSFDIPKGQVVGIIGKNGSGKSTLLKILTGVLSPTSGSVEVHGRVAALLELGAGFNPELTGMENIFLNGHLMGYNHEEMLPRVRGIVDFADIGEFIDQPVKMYSSGMFVRLAFAVAINVDPDVLIVDEALSVGDIRFQQKCIRKIRDFFENGKTVIFVGHDLGAIISFCSTCIWLNEGVLYMQGNPADVVKSYSAFMHYGILPDTGVIETPLNRDLPKEWVDTKLFDSFGDKKAVISEFRVKRDQVLTSGVCCGGESISIELKVNANELVENPIIGFTVKDRLGNTVFGGNSFAYNQDIGKIDPGSHVFTISFEFPFISNGSYSMNLALADGHQQDHVQKHWIHDCFEFKVSRPELRFSLDGGVVLENCLKIIKNENAQINHGSK